MTASTCNLIFALVALAVPVFLGVMTWTLHNIRQDLTWQREAFLAHVLDPDIHLVKGRHYDAHA